MPSHSKWCECEHIAHMEIANLSTAEIIPPTKHPYGKKEGVVDVGTVYGHFWVCQDCKDTCLKHFIGE